MFEYPANFHQHTTHSDGAGTHAEVIRAGQLAGLRVMIFTDHNIYVPDKEAWHGNLLTLMGIEVNDTAQTPEHSHFLALGVDRDLNEYAADPQKLIDKVNEIGGAGFIAHPFEHPAPAFGEGEFPWKHWDVSGYTGLEIWNYMSEFKSLLSGKTKAVAAAFSPDRFITAPFPETLTHWDSLLNAGRKIVAIGGSDAHAQSYSMGPVTRVVFPYKDLFGAVRTHILTDKVLSEDVPTAKLQVLNALKSGHCFVAYDHIGDTTGFSFTAVNADDQMIFSKDATQSVRQGDEIILGDLNMIALNVTVSARAEIRLLKDGKVVAKNRGVALQFIASSAGVYRVECYKVYKTQWRGWIYSNPIYVKNKK